MLNIKLIILTPKRLLKKEEAKEVLDFIFSGYPELTPDRYGYWEPLRDTFDPAHPEKMLSAWPDILFWKNWTIPGLHVEGHIGSSESACHRHGSIAIGLNARKADIARLVTVMQGLSSRLEAHLAFVLFPVPEDTRIGRPTRTISRVSPRKEEYDLIITGHELEKNIPDLYWATVLGKPYIEIFGRERLLTAPAPVVRELSDDCIYIQLSESPLDLVNDYARVDAVRRDVKKHLDCNAFFDPDLPSDHGYNVPKFKFDPEVLPTYDEIMEIRRTKVWSD